MSSILKNFIDTSVTLSDDLPKLPKTACFKEIMLQEEIKIPGKKPDIKEIIKAMVSVNVINKKVITTPTQRRIRGELFTGYELIVEGEVKEKIEYIANLPKQPLDIIYLETPFVSYMMLPSGFKTGTPIELKGYLEDIFMEAREGKILYQGINLLLVAKLRS